MKNGNFDFIGADLCGYKDMRVKEFLPLPPNVTVMVVDTDSEDNVVMRDCVGTSGCYYMAVVEEKKGQVIYPYLLGVNGGLDLRASFVPVRSCHRCGERLKPHMEEGDEGTLYYTCSCCGHRESGWRKESEEKEYDSNRTVGTCDLESDTQKDNSQEDKAHE